MFGMPLLMMSDIMQTGEAIEEGRGPFGWLGDIQGVITQEIVARSVRLFTMLPQPVQCKFIVHYSFSATRFFLRREQSGI